VIIVAGWVDVRPDERSRFLSERREKILETRARPGCITYTLSADAIEPGRVRFFECWEDQTSMDARQQRKAPTPADWVKAIAREVVSYDATVAVPAT
jgi:quinol monooxygenase YgiN